ncbi:MAG: hypothetical protein R2810_03715 [Flavobacteriales bacterium]
MVMLTEGSIQECIMELKKAVELSPEGSGQLRGTVVGLYVGASVPLEAIAAADKAIELAPDENWPYIYRGMNHCWQGSRSRGLHGFRLRWTMNTLLYNLGHAEPGDGRRQIEVALDRVAALPDGWHKTKIEVYPAASPRGLPAPALG